MTVGIGVYCENFRNIILAADTRGSYDHPRLGPNDEMGKQFELPYELYADIAGWFSHCESLISYLNVEMDKLKHIPDVTLGHIREAIYVAQAQELRFRFEAAFRNEMGLSLDEFKQLTNSRMVRRGWALMRKTYIMVELIVAGFNADTSVLLSTAYKEPPEIVSSHVTIGSGGEAALAQLDRRKHNPHYSFERTILHVAEALEEAKVEPTVGQPSDYFILQRGAMRRFKARDPYIKELITKYKGRDSAELDNDEEAKEHIKKLMYKPEITMMELHSHS